MVDATVASPYTLRHRDSGFSHWATGHIYMYSIAVTQTGIHLSSLAIAHRHPGPRTLVLARSCHLGPLNSTQ